MAVNEKKVMIIDNDCGVDDALAILLALKSYHEIMAFTTCRGNTTAENAANNVLRLTNYCGRAEIPVYVGCRLPLVTIGVDNHLCDFHGSDGFGGVADMFPIGDQKVQTEQACAAMVRMAAENPGKITLVAIGPLTNLAVAQRLDPNFQANLKDVFIMGGNYDGIGNTLVAVEFNFLVDPEAAFTVFNEFKCPITVFPWEACLRSVLSWEWYDEWVSHQSRPGRLIHQLLKRCTTANRLEIYPGGLHAPDLQAVACLFWPELITEELSYPVTIELGGTNTRGMMLVDRRSAHRIHYQQEKGNAKVICKLDVPLLEKLLMSMTKEEWCGGTS